MIGLTHRELQLVQFLKSYSDSNEGVMPTFSEMSESMNKNKSDIFRLLVQLQAKGVIRRVHNRPRAIELVDGSMLARAREMRNAIDMIESALMGFGDLGDFPALFETTSPDVKLSVRVTVEQMRRVCAALEEATRIINSDEYLFAKATV